MSGLDGLGWPDEYDGPDNIKDILHDKEIDKMNEIKSHALEIDRLISDYVTVDQVIDLCRKLERERDEARKLAAYYHARYHEDDFKPLPWEVKR